MRVQEYMTQDVQWVQPQTTASEIAKIFAHKPFSSLPVVSESGQVVGIVTESDLVSQEIKLEFPSYFQFVDGYFFAPGKLKEFEDKIDHASKKTAEGLMSSPVYVVHPDTDLSEVASILMEKKISQLPVVDEDKKLLGIISKGDIVRWMAAQHA